MATKLRAVNLALTASIVAVFLLAASLAIILHGVRPVHVKETIETKVLKKLDSIESELRGLRDDIKKTPEQPPS